MIVLENVDKFFGTFQALDDISLTVAKKEVVVVIGPSGSGKSTLIRCINRLEKHDAGRVVVDGVELTDDIRNIHEVRMETGMVFQQFNLWPHLTVVGNLIESPIHVQRRPRDEAIAEADALLDKIGLRDKRDSYPSRLSGGQKQRVAIARALAMKPEVLLFDEPTSSLDPELVGEVLEVMRNLAREGQTMIVVTHELGFAREAADEVLFMDKGVVVETAPPDRFFGSPATARARQFLQRFV